MVLTQTEQEIPMNIELIFGLQTLANFLDLGLSQLEGEFLRCMAYNADLGYALDLIETHDTLKSISIIANEERIKPAEGRTDKVVSLINAGRIRLWHLSENTRIIHAKAYAIYKNDECILMGLGSPNLSKASNLSMELLVVIKPPIPNTTNIIYNK